MDKIFFNISKFLTVRKNRRIITKNKIIDDKNRLNEIFIIFTKLNLFFYETVF